MQQKTVFSIAALSLIAFMFGRYSASLWPNKSDLNTTMDARPSTVASVTNETPTLPHRSEHAQTASPTATKLLDVGQTGKDGGLIFTLESWSESVSLPKRRGGEIRAKEGAKFVAARIKFQNDGKASADIHCSFDLGSALFDKDGRKFDHIKSLYEIEGNTGCNDNIQPGFGSRETIAFELPESFKPDYLMFWDPNDVLGENKDSFGERTAVRFRLK